MNSIDSSVTRVPSVFYEEPWKNKPTSFTDSFGNLSTLRVVHIKPCVFSGKFCFPIRHVYFNLVVVYYYNATEMSFFGRQLMT